MNLGTVSEVWEILREHIDLNDRMDAADSLVTYLIENNFEPPLSIRYDKRFNTMSAEEIYARLAEEFLDQEENDRDYDEKRDNSFEEEKLMANLTAIVEAIVKARPSGAACAGRCAARRSAKLHSSPRRPPHARTAGHRASPHQNQPAAAPPRAPG